MSQTLYNDRDIEGRHHTSATETEMDMSPPKICLALVNPRAVVQLKLRGPVLVCAPTPEVVAHDCAAGEMVLAAYQELLSVLCSRWDVLCCVLDGMVCAMSQMGWYVLYSRMGWYALCCMCHSTCCVSDGMACAVLQMEWYVLCSR